MTRLGNNNYHIRNAADGKYLGYLDLNQGSEVLGQTAPVEWNVQNLGGFGYLLSVPQKTLTLGFNDLVVNDGDKVSLTETIGAHCQVWYLESWDLASKDSAAAVTKQVRIDAGIYQMKNIGSGNYISYLDTSPKTDWINGQYPIVRTPNTTTAGTTHVDWIANVSSDGSIIIYGTSWISWYIGRDAKRVIPELVPRRWKLFKRSDLEGYFIGASPEDGKFQVIVDDPNGTNRGMFDLAPLKVGDSNQRWDFIR